MHDWRDWHWLPFPSIEVTDDAGFEVVDRRDDFHFALAGEAGDELARRDQTCRGPPRALFGGVVDEVARLVPDRDRRRQDRLDHRADRAGIGRVLGDDLA